MPVEEGPDPEEEAERREQQRMKRCPTECDSVGLTDAEYAQAEEDAQRKRDAAEGFSDD